MNTFADLEAKLLSLGGTRVVEQPEPHMEILLERGQVFDAKTSKRKPGARNRCHTNAALLYAEYQATGKGQHCCLVTGYALTPDGIWRQHSWVWDGKRVLETTTKREAYFGVMLTPGEAWLFFAEQVLPELPGYQPLMDQLGGKGDSTRAKETSSAS